MRVCWSAAAAGSATWLDPAAHDPVVPPVIPLGSPVGTQRKTPARAAAAPSAHEATTTSTTARLRMTILLLGRPAGATDGQATRARCAGPRGLPRSRSG